MPMAWQCKKHLKVAISGNEADKPKPSCPTCGNNTFVHWESATVEFVDTLMRAGAAYNVYIESHQGKHVIGGWPGYKGAVGGKYCTFEKSKVKPGQTTGLLPQLWDAVAGTVTHGTANSGYEFMQCSKSVGSDGENLVVLQWAKTKGHYCFHAYPEKSKRPGKTYISAQVN
jgi:hypothetical protein